MSCLIALCFTGTALADPCESGLKLGQRPGPYSFNVATGPERGQQTCYVCSTGDKPAIVIFSRKPSEALGKLINKCDEFLQAQPKDTVKSWMTVLGEKTMSLDELAKWSKNAGIKAVPVGVFDDPVGPPTYKLNGDAEVTVLLWVNRKVIANFAFRAGELDDAAIKKIAEAFPKLVEKK
jgi:hypothetical protein